MIRLLTDSCPRNRRGYLPHLVSRGTGVQISKPPIPQLSFMWQREPSYSAYKVRSKLGIVFIDVRETTRVKANGALLIGNIHLFWGQLNLYQNDNVGYTLYMFAKANMEIHKQWHSFVFLACFPNQQSPPKNDYHFLAGLLNNCGIGQPTSHPPLTSAHTYASIRIMCKCTHLHTYIYIYIHMHIHIPTKHTCRPQGLCYAV